MIKLVIFDYDGVFSDGTVLFNGDDEILKNYNIKDGKGLNLLKQNNIKIGLLSNFSSNKELKFNNKSSENFREHLKFDSFYIGPRDKLEILDLWKNKLNINYDEIAYIGDDVNDIHILEKVGYSGCPNDAVEECKKIVDVICEKNGGYGCVREFCEKIINKKENKIIKEIKSEFLHQIGNFNIEEINNLAISINDCHGIIYFCGVGKSGNIAKHCCDLLKCISIKAFYIDLLNTTHGDIGTMTSKDIILMFSNSGNTMELVNLIYLFKNIGIKTVGICCNEKSKFKELCDHVVVTPFKKEISGEIDKIPTNSFMSHLLFSNILVSLLKNRINIDQYGVNHLSGNIGNDLLKIKDVLINDFPKIILKNTVQLHEVLLKMTEHKMGCCFFIDDERKIIGLLTDGDIRRLFIKDSDIKYIKLEDINTNFYYENDLDKFICDIDKKYNYVPILEKDKLLLNIIKLC
jgi:arabinose-5-phosphate isomerase